MKLKHVLTIAFLGIAVYVAFLLNNNIQDEIKLNKNKLSSIANIKAKLQVLASTQAIFNSKNSRYAGSWEEIKSFLKNDKLYFVDIKEKNVKDSLTGLDSLIIIRDTITSVSVRDSVLKDNKNDNLYIGKIDIIPGADTSFTLKTNSSKSKFEIIAIGKDVPKFEKSPNNFVPFKVGSLNISSTKGNWE